MAAVAIRCRSGYTLVKSGLTLHRSFLAARRFLVSDLNNKCSKDFYEEAIRKKSLVVFMKGIPSEPMCGFSRLVVQILDMHGVKDYDHYNILEDVEFKEAIKKHSEWPTFPQVYVNGEFIGGSDVLLQMHQNGELIDELMKIGHKSSLLENQP